MHEQRFHGFAWFVRLSLIVFVALAGLFVAHSESSGTRAQAGATDINEYPIAITSVYPVIGAVPDATVTLWAQVKNVGASYIDAQVWFWIEGPNWSNWVGPAWMNNLAPGAERWYLVEWHIPKSASIGNYMYWAQVWTTAPISTWSNPQRFMITEKGIPGAASLTAPNGVFSAITFTYTWKAVAPATYYYLWVNDPVSSSGKIKIWYSSIDAGCAEGTGNCSVTPATAMAKGACQWWVQTWNASGYGPWSDGMSFTAGAAMSMAFVTIPPGEFQMGSTNGEKNETPVHRVSISKSFQLGTCEVTQGQWKTMMQSNPSYFKGDDNRPVENVTWDESQGFIARMNALHDGFHYRLPTEAEWEYACRAGTTGDYAGNPDDMGWFIPNAEGKTHPAGTKLPNAWGLYDMHGNVFEWVQDWYGENYYAISPAIDPQGPASGVYRVNRGGCYHYYNYFCRSAYRADEILPSSGWPGLGFRLVRTPQ